MGAPGLASLQKEFRDRGFAVCNPAIPPEILAETNSALEAIRNRARTLPPDLAARLTWEKDLPDTKRGGIAADRTGDALFLIGDLPAFNPCFASLLTAPPLLEMVRVLLGTGDICHHFSNLTTKSKLVGSGISWHRDFPNRYLCPRSSSFLRLMICLDGMTENNGATRFVLNSHRISDAAARGAEARKEAEKTGAVIETAVCPPGSAVFIHPKIIHGGPPNTSPDERRNIIIQWGRTDDPILGPGTETLAGFSVPQIQEWAARNGDPAPPSWRGLDLLPDNPKP